MTPCHPNPSALSRAGVRRWGRGVQSSIVHLMRHPVSSWASRVARRYTVWCYRTLRCRAETHPIPSRPLPQRQTDQPGGHDLTQDGVVCRVPVVTAGVNRCIACNALTTKRRDDMLTEFVFIYKFAPSQNDLTEPLWHQRNAVDDRQTEVFNSVDVLTHPLH